ncbi:unnamed protein product [Spirodela intermedia]|uniref:Uncharacterized protein n=1 Tax=Spirodela intermedia TaxID=51605 RepID=A0A7I8LHF9_SPIIN|nr:unnamed protein product [Spirodela intermedia]
METTKKPSNKIADIVRLQRMLKKWKKAADSHKGSGDKKRNGVPKGFLSVSVGEEMRRFVIPTAHLGHRAFLSLLKEAEEEFGFQHEGVLRIPCAASLFESILEVVEKEKKKKRKGKEVYGSCSAEADVMDRFRRQTQKPICG